MGEVSEGASFLPDDPREAGPRFVFVGALRAASSSVRIQRMGAAEKDNRSTEKLFRSKAAKTKKTRPVKSAPGSFSERFFNRGRT
jgi:hypothetical protein